MGSVENTVTVCPSVVNGLYISGRENCDNQFGMNWEIYRFIFFFLLTISNLICREFHNLPIRTVGFHGAKKKSIEHTGEINGVWIY